MASNNNTTSSTDAITSAQRKECVKILRSFYDISNIVDIDLTRLLEMATGISLQKPLPTNPQPSSRTVLHESLEFCYYFALANMRLRIRAHQIAGLNETECDFLSTFDMQLVAAFKQYDVLYQSMKNGGKTSFEQLTNRELLEGSRSVIAWVNVMAHNLNIIYHLHQRHAAEVYCDNTLTQLVDQTERVFQRIADSFLRAELWDPVEPEITPFRPEPMISFRHALPELTTPLVKPPPRLDHFGDPVNKPTRFPQPLTSTIQQRQTRLEREIAKLMTEWIAIEDKDGLSQIHPSTNRLENDPFYPQLEASFSLPPYRTPYAPDPNHDENTCSGCTSYAIRRQNAISASLLCDSAFTGPMSADEDIRMSSPTAPPPLRLLSPADPDLLSIPLERVAKVKNHVFVDVPSMKSQGKRRARDPTPSEPKSDGEWQPDSDAIPAKHQASEDLTLTKSTKKPKPGSFKASSSGKPRKPRSELVADLDAIREWVSKPLRNTPVMYFAYPSYTDSDLLPSIPWTTDDDQQIHPPSHTERVNRVSQYAAPQMVIRPKNMWRSTTPPPVVSNRSFSHVQGNFTLSRTPGVIYLLPRDPCRLCVRQGFVCAYVKTACFSWDDDEPEKSCRCLGCRWRSQKCVLEEVDQPHLRPYQWDGYKFVPFHHRRPFVAPIDNNLTPTTQRWRDIDTEMDRGNAEAGPSGSS
ncbi:hypothetical protein K435DRAFT_877372 [Dendrothele bispora CBS 962.96]|uniref:Uncharacterized protein n=1 Tax=Dendrothele bispora (strain CBS 962.96) TaxID=1314807 RepID=A0A4S8KQ35_DENBC|nr:hypothetical protein K435DRAFT_877372 [Dendrothele bispora CBS 962.96]